MVRSFAACGLHQGDIVQNAYGYGLFTGGLGNALRGEALGRRSSPFRRQHRPADHADEGFWRDGHLLHAELLYPPDRAGRGDGCQFEGTAPADRRLWGGALVGIMRRYIRENSTSSRMIFTASPKLPGRAWRWSAAAMLGCTSSRTISIPEIVDPQSGQVLPDETEGELVLTTLSKQAMPILRYRTRDITTLIAEPCACGRTLRRFRRVGRRSDDMFIIRGINVFPSQVETALLQVEGTLPHYQIVLTRAKGLDQMEVQVEVTPEVFSDTVGGLESLQQTLESAVEQTIGIRASVRLVEPHTLQRSEGKAKRVVDQRKL